MRPPPGAEQVRTRSLWPLPPPILLTVLTLLGIFLLGWFSVLTRPAQSLAAVWWPASGLALGLAIRTPARRLWLVSLAVSAVLLGANLAQYQSAPIAVAASLSAGVEVALSAWILRALSKDPEALATPRDLAVLLFAVVAGATAYDLTIAATAWATGDVTSAIAHLFSAGPRRAAGTLMVAPLFMRLPVLERRPDAVQTTYRIGLGLVVAGAIFAVNSYLPLSFLALVPPVWSALSLAARWLFVEMLGIAVIASYASITGSGPFSFLRFGPTVGSTLLEAFELTMVTIVMLVALTVSREREAAARLSAGELVYRRNFETSLAGVLVVVAGDDHWTVERFNPAAAAMFPQLGEGFAKLEELVGIEAAGTVIAAARQEPLPTAGFDIEIPDGRHLQVSMAQLDLDIEGTVAIQVLDQTDSFLAQRQAAAELERAGQVQRALSPAELPTRPGWEHGAAAIPAREVGGDFFDLRIEGRFAAMTLGDVMGKGIGAGILAAATRTALRAVSPASRPTDVLADSIRVIDEDLRRSSAFVTLGYAAIDLMSGDVRLVDAGHGLSFVVRDSGRSVERLASFDLPLGIGGEWSELRTTLAPGDSLLMVSDGVLDAWSGSVDELMDGLRSLRNDPSVKDPQMFVDSLCLSMQDQPDVGDDVTAVMFHRQGSNS